MINTKTHKDGRIEVNIARPADIFDLEENAKNIIMLQHEIAGIYHAIEGIYGEKILIEMLSGSINDWKSLKDED